MSSLFRDSPEYLRRKQTPFRPTKLTLADIHAVVPSHLREKNTPKALLYVTRDILCALVAYKFACFIDPLARYLLREFSLAPILVNSVKWALWGLYWCTQSIIFVGWFTMGHDAGHMTLSSHPWVNHVIGFPLHTFLLIPYWSWRSTHRAHHQGTMSIERDEIYVPRTRSQLGLPPKHLARLADYEDKFGDTPIATLLSLIIMQTIGLNLYLFTNIWGSAKYPAWTNHFSPYSALFKPQERKGVIISDLGLLTMMFFLHQWSRIVGFSAFVKLYFIPYIFMNHWFIMITFLHHTDPTVPVYRGKEWTWLRGALATVDRPFLGWIGRFFLHNVSHDHVAHHLFSQVPFYNLPLVTEHIKKVLKDDYNYDSTNSFRALYRTFTECCFVEDDGEIVFFKNKNGETARELAGPEVD